MDILKIAEERGIEITTELNTIAMARNMGIENINVHFDGGGDEGYIESIEYYPDYSDWKGTEEEKQSFTSFMDDVAAMHLAVNYAGGGWFNNGGGTGSLNLNVKTGEMTTDVVFREETYNEYNLLTEAGIVEE